MFKCKGQGMSEVRILIFNQVPEEAGLLKQLCGPIAPAVVSSSIENTQAFLKTTVPDAFLIDASLAGQASFQDLMKKTTSIVITGKDEALLRARVDLFFGGHHTGYLVLPAEGAGWASSQKVIRDAVEHSRLLAELEDLKQSKESTRRKLEELRRQIKEISIALPGHLAKELEKRIDLRARYIWFQKEKQKVERILRKLYLADDVGALLDSVFDIRELIQAEGISIYIREENETLGPYLKPLVWVNDFLSHADFAQHIALISAQDFAASVVRSGQEVAVAEIPGDPRLSPRYREKLHFPLRNILCVPIRHDKETIGVVEVYNKTVKGSVSPSGFTLEDRQVLHGLSEHISIAMTKLNLIQHDALTGLLRPDAFMDKVIQKISSQSKRRQEEGSFAIVMGDVDWFKNYNDRNGHEAGNRCLRELAGVLRSSIRDEDLICRYGGEEFLFFLTGVKTKEEAMLLTERIRQNVEERYFPFQEYQPRNNLTMSFGVTVCIRNNDQLTTPLTKNEIKKIIHYADLAMAEAKGKKTAALRGEEAEKIMTKNKVCLFRPELAKEEEKLDLEAKERPFLEKRRHERYFASTPLIYKENGSHRVTHTINLSLGGAKIPCDRNLSLHKIIDLFLILGEKASPLKGDIVYSEKGGGDYPSFYTGLKFLDLTPHDKLSLLAFFQTLGKKP